MEAPDETEFHPSHIGNPRQPLRVAEAIAQMKPNRRFLLCVIFISLVLGLAITLLWVMEQNSYERMRTQHIMVLDDLVKQNATADEVIKVLGREFKLSMSEAEGVVGKHTVLRQGNMSSLGFIQTNLSYSYFIPNGDFIVIVGYNVQRRIVDYAIGPQ
ncbi:MAG: hypothetical protein IH623_28715 [Verrucomicrobia bacterium]|nr:hypothetical protein [Verrucomicrobiota bacterium]